MARITPESERDVEYYDQMIKDLLFELSYFERQIKSMNFKLSKTKSKLETTQGMSDSDPSILTGHIEGILSSPVEKFDKKSFNLKKYKLIEEKKKQIESLRTEVEKKRLELKKRRDTYDDATAYLRRYYKKKKGDAGHDRYTMIMDRIPKAERKKVRIMDSGQVFEVDRIYVEGQGLLTWDDAAKEYLRRGLGIWDTSSITRDTDKDDNKENPF